ncbi:hypothetical protein ACQE3E_01410 [Methylomonas sp. MED-D]|uniref:hypothetical protein n=1 Tax=Methylomonas sp. MED-D TaxID=3418768 RepID=UPI003D03972C
MTTTVVSGLPSARSEFSDAVLVGAIVDRVCEKMLDDYRINRFFNNRPVAEHAKALKAYLNVALSSDLDASKLLDAYFAVAFGRDSSKPRTSAGHNFVPLPDVVRAEEARANNLLCPAHRCLMKFHPDDAHYDVAMAHLAAVLGELKVSEAGTYRLTMLAESVRDAVLGRRVYDRKVA